MELASDSFEEDDPIHLCGTAALEALQNRPESVLRLAYSKLTAQPFSEAPLHWRRLFEEASLRRANELLIKQASASISTREDGAKRRKTCGQVCQIQMNDPFSEIIAVLDRGILISGAPARKATYDNVFKQLEMFGDYDPYNNVPEAFPVACPTINKTEHPVARTNKAAGFENFQTWLNHSNQPLIMAGSFEHWPARRRWQDPQYLFRVTLGGRRMVPVETGSSYTEDGWGQKAMTFGDFITKYLLPEDAAEMGYLAQHDLLYQIPALRNDVMIPDYCYASPPLLSEAAARNTAGLADTEQLENPLFNAWLGPKGTKTPLHTDPYYNILCQVVGYKYVRLYAPAEAPNLYPYGVDEQGVGMQNTSQVDVALVRSKSMGKCTDEKAMRDVIRKFPRFMGAKYQEAILGPGECLYIPLGWWHYVESLTTSFSVSFWWN